MTEQAQRRALEDALFTELHDATTSVGRRSTIRDELVAMHMPLVRHIARRYADRGEPMDDLVQAGSLGLINAVDRFEPQRGVAFSSYAVPTIVGAIRRYFRDSTWMVKVPRHLQEMRGRIDAAHDHLAQELGRSPTVAEIAQRADLQAQDVLDALELGHLREITPLDTGDSEDGPVSDRIGVRDAAFDRVDDSETVERLLTTLPERERTMVEMRFFDGLSQSQIAERMGVSQMHVSRLLAQSLTQLRDKVVT